VQVAGLFTTLDEASERVPIHHVRKSLLEEQARAAGIRLHCIDIPGDCPNEVYEERLNLFLKTMKDVTHLAFGDLFLEDIRRYRERQFAASGLGLLFPLWGSPTPALAREMTRAGVRAVITCVDTSVAPREWAGRLFDSAFVEAIPPGIDPCGENGEFHTFVCEGPMLAAPLRVRPGAIAGDGRFIYSDLAVH
jgi:uncharacterized protein (TIGR00290 family)